MNQFFFVGVVDRVETKTADNGKSFLEVSVEYTEQGKDRDFKTWFRVACYGKLAEKAGTLGAGETVVVSGKLYNAKRKNGEKTFYNLALMALSIEVVGAQIQQPSLGDDDIAF